MCRNLIKILLFAAVCALLSLVCAVNPELPAGETFGQWVWFGKAVPMAAGCVVLASLIAPKKNRSWKSLFIFPDFPRMVGWALMFWGAVEAVWGLRQLYGFAASGHSRYALTGSFFNPGPYAGYLAMVLPLSLYYYTYFQWEWKFLDWHHRADKILGVVSGILILGVLPATMSRSAWIAAFLSCGWVIYILRDKGYKRNILWRRYKKKYIKCAVGISAFALLIGGITMFQMKSDSALGRLFLWKMTCHAIAQHPIAGSFAPAVAYSKAQEAYFAKGDYAVWEERVAGSPEYPFNEYLGVVMEGGLILLILILIVVGISIWCAVKNGEYGVCGALISLMVFAFSSYPFQFPAFIVALLCLLIACSELGRFTGKSIIVGLALGMLIFGANGQMEERMEKYKEWTHAKMLYQTGAYEAAAEKYKEIRFTFKEKAPLLFEYGHCLHKLGRYEDSNRRLEDAERLSTDPMILNVMGKNYQALGDYKEAEKCFIRSIHRLPGRIYPYYLLAKLYAEPKYWHPEKFEEMRRVVLTKDPKVESTAIREMREELKKLSKQNTK